MRNVRIDKVLQRIGGFGRWQRVQLTFLAPSSVFVCWLNLIYIFITSYEFDETCDNGHDHNSTKSILHKDEAAINFTTTIEWNLNCVRKWLRPAQQVCFSIGAMMGVPIFYFLSSKFGRKRSLLLTVGLLTVVGSVTPYSHWHKLYCIFRFISGLLAGGLRICTLLLSLETANSRYHAWILSVWDVIQAIGYMLLASLASVSGDWRIIYVVSTVPVCILMTYAWLIPESPRWLLMIRRKADAERILRKIAKTNHHILRHESVQNLTISEREVIAYNSYTFKHILNDWRMSLWLFELLACWFLAFTAYYTFSFSIPSIGNEFDKHLLFELHSWAGFVEIFSIGIGLVAVNFFPRKNICLVAIALCGILCALTGVVRSRSHYVPLAALSICAKLFLVTYTSTLQLMTLELFPKEIRFLIIAVTLSISNCGIAVGAVLAVTAEIFPFFPFMACGGAAFLIFGLTCLLPETFRHNFDELEQEQNIASIDTPPTDPIIVGRSEPGAFVEMQALRNKSDSLLNESVSIEEKPEFEQI